MLELIIVILVILWLLGYVGPVSFRRGNGIHILLVIILILVLVRYL